MEFQELVGVVGALSMLYFGPLGYFVLRDRPDLERLVDDLLVRTMSNQTTCTFLEFCEYERRVRGGAPLNGKNREVLHLAFPKRYFFGALLMSCFSSGGAAVFFMVIRLLEIEEGTKARDVLWSGSTVPVSVVGFFAMSLLYLLVSILCVTQKKAVERELARLS